MGIILGFGSTEEEQRKNIYENIKDIIYKAVENNKGYDDSYAYFRYTEEALEEIKSNIEVLRKELYDRHSEMSENYYQNAPERHTYFWYNIAHNHSIIFILVEFNHVNTKHALSPAGVATFEMEECYFFKIDDIRDELLSDKKVE